ncbi:zinc peptidase [Cyanosarcina cf. burmensis CCALA 770]|nr:zinc peptidase [Cyanosarcina cf. burmensis CCALA 770]
MSLRHGFKKEANDYAREFRAELSLAPHARLRPWMLAEHLTIPVIPLSSFGNQIPTEVRHLTTRDLKSFSAVTVFEGRRRLIVHNDAHHRHRQASNITHELSHAILQHPPTEPFNEYGCRNFNKDIEDEANWLGPALLISEEAALHIVKTGMSMEDASQSFGASKEVVIMRVNVTGARRRITARLHKR